MLRSLAIVVLGGIMWLGCEQPPAPRPAVPLEWTACPFDTDGFDTLRMKCGRVTVPENRDADHGRRIRLAFAVIRASAPSGARDAIVELSGGPGSGALRPIFLGIIGPGLASDRDVVAFDQRGTGYSEPPMCPGRAAEDMRIDAQAVSGAPRRALIRTADLACRDAMLKDSVDLRAYHSRASADDAEDLRRALGYDRWTVIGSSYGGALAQSVVSRYPASVRAAVLVVPTRFDDVPEFDWVRSIGGTLRMLNAVCAADAACRSEHPDLEAEFYAVAQEFIRVPLSITVDSAAMGLSTFVVDAPDFITVIDEMSARDWELPFVPGIIRAFHNRDSAVVRAAIERSYGSAAGGAGFSAGMQMTVRCHDFVNQETRRRREQVVAAFPLEDEMTFAPDPCDVWPTGHASRREREPRGGDIPTLILSGRYDNRAPVAYSAGIMETFRRSKQIVFANASHDLPGPTTWDCFRAIVLEFARDPATFPDGACAATTKPVTVSDALPEWATAAAHR
jgi:pimeloyl-ACP methyl ester carboxylesterase